MRTIEEIKAVLIKLRDHDDEYGDLTGYEVAQDVLDYIDGKEIDDEDGEDDEDEDDIIVEDVLERAKEEGVI